MWILILWCVKTVNDSRETDCVLLIVPVGNGHLLRKLSNMYHIKNKNGKRSVAIDLRMLSNSHQLLPLDKRNNKAEQK
jgi:hypothetical protein